MITIKNDEFYKVNNGPYTILTHHNPLCPMMSQLTFHEKELDHADDDLQKLLRARIIHILENAPEKIKGGNS